MLQSVNFTIFNNDYSYCRNVNPMLESVENRISAIYDAGRTVLTNSGMEAISLTFDYIYNWLNKPVINVIVNRNTYYETRQWLEINRQLNPIVVDMHDLDKLKRLSECVDINVFYLDNPDVTSQLYDVKKIAGIAHQKKALLVVDNTLLSCYYRNPLKEGADIAVESFSKYVAGHGDVMAGGIMFSKSFVADNFFDQEYLDIFLGRRGRSIFPLSIYLVDRGLDTLEVRMLRHTETASAIDAYLLAHNINVWYAGLGGILVVPGKDKSFLERFKAFKMLPTFGATFSTCSFVRRSDLYSVGDYIRLSVGLEAPEILLSDVKRAFQLEGD